jgi:hypothetical protein
MSTRFVPLTPILCTALLCAGCSGSDAPRSASSAAQSPQTAAVKTESKLDLCSLLTADEIEAVTGAKVVEAKAEGHGAVGTCNYQAANELLPVVSLVLAPGMPNVSSSEEMAAWRSKQSMSFGDIKVTITPIEGLGVPAIRNEVEGLGLVTIEAAAKGRLLDVTTSSLDKSKALVPKALARVP